MRPLRWKIARAFDALAIAVVLWAAYHFAIAPRLHGTLERPAPPIALAALDGPRFSLSAHHGRLVFLDFWASWCPPCKASLPLVEDYARSHPAVDVVAVDVGEPERTAALYARAQGLRNVVFDPDATAAHAFGVGNFPTMVIVDPAGTVRATWIGFNPLIEPAMSDAVRRYGTPGSQRSRAGTSSLLRPKNRLAFLQERPGPLTDVGRPNQRTEVQRFER